MRAAELTQAPGLQSSCPTIIECSGSMWYGCDNDTPHTCFGANFYNLKLFLVDNSVQVNQIKQARKPRSYDSLKLRPIYLLTRVKSRATSAAKNVIESSEEFRGGICMCVKT